MSEPEWAHLKFPQINYQDIIYYSAPKVKQKLKDLNEVDPELLKTFEKLGISLTEQKRLANVAVDAVFDSVSIATFDSRFCSVNEIPNFSKVRSNSGSTSLRSFNF